MRCQTIVIVLNLLLFSGLLMVVIHQHRLLTRSNNESGMLKKKLDDLDKQIAQEDLTKAAMENVIDQGDKATEALGTALAKLRTEMDKLKTENDACQAEKKTTTEELTVREKERSETEATLKAESDAWSKDIDSLNAQLTGYPKICDYVKKGSNVVFCAKTTPEDKGRNISVTI